MTPEEQIKLLERKLHQADNRIADLESRERRREHYDKDKQKQLVEATATIIELRREVLELEARIRDNHVSATDASAMAERALSKLVLWEPIVEGTKELFAAMKAEDRVAGDAACVKIRTALLALEMVPRA